MKFLDFCKSKNIDYRQRIHFAGYLVNTIGYKVDYIQRGNLDLNDYEHAHSEFMTLYFKNTSIHNKIISGEK